MKIEALSGSEQTASLTNEESPWCKIPPPALLVWRGRVTNVTD